MQEVMEPILPLVPVEDIAVHIARSGLSMGDRCEARLLADGRVGVFARVRKRVLGLLPLWREGYLGHLGPMAAEVVAPAILDSAILRVRVVQLTPEHLAGTGMPEIMISVWGDPRWLAPLLAVHPAFLREQPAAADSSAEDPAPRSRPRRLKPV